MRLRPRSDVSAPDAAERMRGLLVPATTGWVPPPERSSSDRPEPGGSSTGGCPALGAEPLTAPGELEPAAPSAAQVAASDAQPDAPSSWAEREADGPGSWTGPEAHEPAREDATPQRPWVPAALTGSRLDPGRRGAVALVVAALVAAAVATAVVLAGRPREVVAPEVPVPDVVASGVPLPGGATPPARGAAQTGAAPSGAGAVAPGSAPAGSAPSGEVVVAVAGEVQRPGLVRLPAGSRVDDAVRAAGGPLPGTDPGLLNLARRLVDGEQVLVGVGPPPGAAPAAPAAAPPPDGTAPPGGGGPLDLNAATVSDLDALPGIGPVLAQRIVEWRTEHGRFASVEQLREVTGIGESKYADLEDQVRV